MTKECEKKNAVYETETSEVVNSAKSSVQQKGYTIEYSAMSRGIFKEIKIKKDSISVQKSRNAKPEIQPCNEELWGEIIGKIEHIDLESLENLEAPTGKRLYDGAAHATLKISVDGKTYSTSSFDHGFPPKDIQGICDILFKLIED